MEITKMAPGDREEVLAMMKVFYSSPAVLTSGSAEIFENDFAACVENSPYLEGYLFREDGDVIGYAMAAKSFSTEFGKPCVWIEDLYLKPAFRGQGRAALFFSFLEEHHPDAIFRLEAEKENVGAVRAYRKNGFDELPYMELIKRK